MRKSGILMLIYSLPSEFGIGKLGDSAYMFANFLRDCGVQVWQILPLSPTSYGDSPYQSFSVHAGNPYFIDFQRLEKQGYLVRSTSPYDKRIRLLTLTAEGRAILEKLSCVIETYQERVTQTIPEADLATFSATLNQIACRLRNIREEDNKI